MNINFVILGLVFELIGGFIMLIINLSKMTYQKTYTNEWKTRYWWLGWKVKSIFPLKVKRKSRMGFISPKIVLIWVGFLFIVVGSVFQITQLSQ